MAFEFEFNDGSYREDFDSVFFVTQGSGKDFYCRVSRNALEDKSETTDLTIEELVAVFNKHRPELEAIAVKKHSLGMVEASGIILVSTHDLNP